MAAGYQELFLEQGANFSTSITLDGENGLPLNLTNYTAKSVIKKSYYSSTITEQFVLSINIPTNGTILFSLPSANTANVPAGRYVYDVIIKDSANTVTRVLEGIVNVLPSVTVF
jgi:hypothetical protein